MNHTANENIKKDSYNVSSKTNQKIKPSLSPTEERNKIISDLSGFQKILLITNGSVTELIEHYVNEQIKSDKIRETICADNNDIPLNHRIWTNEEKTPILLREVLLKGKESSNIYMYAESCILTNNLPDDFKNDLIHSDIPIGKLWAKHRLETYKTNFTIQKEKANENIAKHLGVTINSNVLSRTYCVYSQGKRTMIITEKFSDQEFTN